jgi:putative nucleotidyltransferase with HDIG domain
MNNRLFQDLYEDLVDDRLVIPTLPKIAMQIRQLFDEDVELRKVEVVIQTDPALAVMLMKVANSALFRTVNPVKTVEQAILRLGLKMVRNLVFAYSMRELFNSRFPYINQRLKNLWVHSVEVATVSYVLARKLGRFDPDYALLLGLLHDIGMLPILYYTERYPEIADSPEQLDTAIEQLHGEMGAIILKEWHFSEEFVTVSREADDWYRDSGKEADYCDLVLIAQLHTFIGKAKDKVQQLIGEGKLPVLVDLPAFQKLGLHQDDPQESLSILAGANEQLQEARQIFAI